jgi:hypothetical protein
MHVYGSKNTLDYLGIPLSFKYHVGLGKFSLSPQFGLNLNLLLNQKIVAEINSGGNKERETMNDIQGLKSSYVSGILGMNARYAVNSRLSLIVAPEAKLALTAINKNAPVRSYRQSLGLAAGVQVDF